jgi:hypothetical protein
VRQLNGTWDTNGMGRGTRDKGRENGRARLLPSRNLSANREMGKSAGREQRRVENGE